MVRIVKSFREQPSTHVDRHYKRWIRRILNIENTFSSSMEAVFHQKVYGEARKRASRVDRHIYDIFSCQR